MNKMREAITENMIAITMYKSIPVEYLKRGYGKYEQRYGLLLERSKGIKDKEFLKKLWAEIKHEQKTYPEYMLNLAEDPIVKISHTNRMFYYKYAQHLLIKYYEDKGEEFVRKELEEYKDSYRKKNPDPIELFDSLFMLAMYSIAGKLEYEQTIRLLKEIIETYEILSKSNFFIY